MNQLDDHVVSNISNQLAATSSVSVVDSQDVVETRSVETDGHRRRQPSRISRMSGAFFPTNVDIRSNVDRQSTSRRVLTASIIDSGGEQLSYIDIGDCAYHYHCDSLF